MILADTDPILTGDQRKGWFVLANGYGTFLKSNNWFSYFWKGLPTLKLMKKVVTFYLSVICDPIHLLVFWFLKEI